MPCNGLYTENEVQELQERIKELQIALRPFALMWDESKLSTRVRTLDLKRAAEVYYKGVSRES